MENAIGCIVGNAYTSMLSSTGRHLSSAIWGKVSCFVAGAVAGAGVTYCVIKGKEIREKLLTLMVVDPKTSKTFILDNLSHKSWKHAGNIYKIINCTTVHIGLSVPEDNGRFSKGNNIELLHKSSAEQTVGASDLFAGEVPKEHDLFSCTQHLETMSPLPKENAADGQRTSEVAVSYPVFSNSTFCLPLSNEIIGKLFNGMRGKYFHEKTSLELLTYVLTGRGEKSEGTISIEWIASPRSFSLFIGIVCAPYHNKWKMGKSLFTGRINKNPSCDFSRMTELGLVDNNRVSPALKKNNYFVREKDKDLKFLLVFLYELF